MPRAWYSYNGGIPANVAASWDLMDPQEPECLGTSQLCALSAYFAGIVAPAPHPKPPLSNNLRDYILKAATTSVHQVPQFDDLGYVLKKSS
ncbi:hypothetical protein OQY15_01595 [Pedobacter sp. MC2016-15]|uniref:hypothetical protein n=1 Tax=Pedobacter sp. MC2016-15 TaxID=2994473 RepID=UPI00224773E5|nr:hypothetical protein [Pedobacter sp. MC2016-15]MCX2477762.1 hypothetical protein [Pedobacter sp. MC2016-15]